MRILWFLLLLALSGISSAAPVPPFYTYQGELKENGIPKNGSVDLVFRVFDSAQGGTEVNVVTTDNIAVSGGLFTALLALDPSLFRVGGAWWLEVEVRDGALSGAEPFQKLSPRQPILSVPYATNADSLDGARSSEFLKASSASAFKRSEFGNESIPAYGQPETSIDSIGVTAPASGKIVFRARGVCELGADDTYDQEVRLGLGRNQAESLESRYINGATVYLPPAAAVSGWAAVPFTLEREYSLTAGESIAIFLFAGKSDGLEPAQCSGSLSAEFFTSAF